MSGRYRYDRWPRSNSADWCCSHTAVHIWPSLSLWHCLVACGSGDLSSIPSTSITLHILLDASMKAEVSGGYRICQFIVKWTQVHNSQYKLIKNTKYTKTIEHHEYPEALTGITVQKSNKVFWKTVKNTVSTIRTTRTLKKIHCRFKSKKITKFLAIQTELNPIPLIMKALNCNMLLKCFGSSHTWLQRGYR